MHIWEFCDDQYHYSHCIKEEPRVVVVRGMTCNQIPATKCKLNLNNTYEAKKEVKARLLGY